MPNLDPQISKLLQLKRYEQPEEDFVEEFLKEFQQRQRGELLQKSSIALFRERFQQWFADSSAPIWTSAAVAAAVVALIALGNVQPTMTHDNLASVSGSVEQRNSSFPIELESNPFGSAENVHLSASYYDALPVATVTSFEF